MDASRLNPWNWFKREEEHAENPRTPDIRRPGQCTSPRQLHAEFDRLFDGMFRNFMMPLRPGFAFPSLPERPLLDAMLRPRLDVSGTEKEYLVAVELPGVDEKNVRLELHNDTLVIRGEKKHETESEEKGYYRMERSYGSFERVLALPKDVDTAGIRAAHKDGVLTITLPRTANAPAESRTIPIGKEGQGE